MHLTVSTFSTPSNQVWFEKFLLDSILNKIVFYYRNFGSDLNQWSVSVMPDMLALLLRNNVQGGEKILMGLVDEFICKMNNR